MMLPSLRQTTSRLIPRLLPRPAWSVSVHTTSKAFETQEDEALSILNDGAKTTAVNANPFQSTPPVKLTANLDIMHHYIPPAQSPILQLLTTMMMKDGKYASAAKSTSQLLLHLYVMTRSKPMPIVEQAVLLVSPSVRLRKQKQGGGKTVLKPMALSERQRTRLGIKWLIDAADTKGNPGKTREERLAKEIITALKGEGSAIKAKSDMHKAAMVNRGNLPKRF